MKMSQWFRI